MPAFVPATAPAQAGRGATACSLIASQLCGGIVAAPPDQHGDPVQDPALALASAGTCRALVKLGGQPGQLRER